MMIAAWQNEKADQALPGKALFIAQDLIFDQFPTKASTFSTACSNLGQFHHLCIFRVISQV